MFHNNTVKIWENEQANLLKIYLQVTNPVDFCIICIHFYNGEKVKIYDCVKTNDYDKSFCA